MVVEQDYSTANISEEKTRRDLIDPELDKRNWNWKYIKEEINTVRSNLVDNNLLFYKDGKQKGDRFSDYLLIDEDFSPLAVIEAKRYSKNEERGRDQARTYAKDVQYQIGYGIPIFLTNGEKWIFIDEDGIERKVSGPFSQEDLHRRSNLYRVRQDASKVKYDTKIVDRAKGVIIVRKLSEFFTKLHRKALVHMATGTGKTRVAMAITKLLIDANMARNVLFVADRTALVDQAKSDGFNQFFREPIIDIRTDDTQTGRLYVSTVQTLMNPYKNPTYRKFSPGFFDLIIFDEAHRSYYDKQNVIEEYFDAIKIGLTATPKKHESKNTFKMFDCPAGKSTVEYRYEDAVRDEVLVPYTVVH